jgi:hypothetical protein
MNTTTAAATAHVTARTIQAWCRRGAVHATKTGGRWDIDTDSLNRRIALGAKRAAQASSISFTRGALIANGPEGALAAALASGRPVQITDGTCAGDTVYLGLRGTTYGDYGISATVTGRIVQYTNGDAGYAIDTTRLELAPILAAGLARRAAKAAEAEIQRLRAEHDYLNPSYE